jgi:glutathione synthase/RimK-type ligase-like ATP-grasp enzyme
MIIGILKSFKEIDKFVQGYIDACEYAKVDYVILDLLSDTWIEDIKNSKVDGILVRIKGNIPEHKALFDERLSIINDDLGIPIYPSRKELFLYENKRMYAYWLKAHNLPHAGTHVFYSKQQALNFIEKAKMPLVFKTNGGASSSGVEIIQGRFKAKLNIHRIFGLFDARLSFGKVHFGKMGFLPVPKFGMAQKHYVIIQEFIPIKWEWRIIKIGNTYSGHQKLLKGQFASGSDLVGWVEPPKELLLMVKNLCEIENFDSMAMDVLESLDGKYYINEIQSLFGSYLPYQMKINDVPGRFIEKEGGFIFESGEFHTFGSNKLRVEYFLIKLEKAVYSSNNN